MRESQFNAKKVLSGVLVAGTLLTASMNTINSVANAEDIGNYPKAEVPTKDSEASNKYAMIAKFTDKTKLEFLSAKDKLKTVTSGAGNKIQAFVGLTTSDCGKDIAKYTNVGLWKGKEIDVIYKLDSFKKAGFKGGEWIEFNDKNIGLAQGGYKASVQ